VSFYKTDFLLGYGLPMCYSDS